MSIKDRTGEYWSIVHSFSSSQAVQPLRGDQQLTRSEFMLKASEIGKEVFSVGSKLEKLAKCKNFMNSVAKSKSIFDDKPAEIEELTFVIKKDIANLNQQIAELQHAKGKPKGKQSEEHNANVLVSLQSKLAYTSNTFKNVLEVRTQNMKIQKDRRDQFSSQLATSVITNPIPKPVEYPVQTYQQLELIEKQVELNDSSKEHLSRKQTYCYRKHRIYNRRIRSNFSAACTHGC